MRWPLSVDPVASVTRNESLFWEFQYWWRCLCWWRDCHSHTFPQVLWTASFSIFRNKSPPMWKRDIFNISFISTGHRWDWKIANKNFCLSQIFLKRDGDVWEMSASFWVSEEISTTSQSENQFCSAQVSGVEANFRVLSSIFVYFESCDRKIKFWLICETSEIFQDIVQSALGIFKGYFSIFHLKRCSRNLKTSFYIILYSLYYYLFIFLYFITNFPQSINNFHWKRSFK